MVGANKLDSTTVYQVECNESKWNFDIVIRAEIFFLFANGLINIFVSIWLFLETAPTTAQPANQGKVDSTSITHELLLLS